MVMTFFVKKYMNDKKCHYKLAFSCQHSVGYFKKVDINDTVVNINDTVVDITDTLRDIRSTNDR